MTDRIDTAIPLFFLVSFVLLFGGSLYYFPMDLGATIMWLL